MILALVITAVLAVSGGVYALSRDDGDHGRRAAPTRRRDVAAATTASTTSSSSPVPSAASTSSPSTSPTPPAAGSGLAAVAGRTIVIDPGHNGQNGQHPDVIARPVDIGTQTRACDTTGTQTAQGYTESAYNLDVSLRLVVVLRSAGANVVLTRTDDSGIGPCIDERAGIGNRAHADVGISIHADGGPPGGRGFHVIYPPSLPGLTDDIATNSKRLALDVRAAYQAATGMPYADYIGNQGLDVRTDLGGLNLSDVPKVFIESGNMRNVTDAALLTNPEFRQRAAEGIANGLAGYLAGK
jgi:N-acetylmuramoyl-L-alanine amidase